MTVDIFLKYLGVFAVGGALCAIAQILLDKTKLTSARILVLYVVSGVVLTAVGIYDYVVKTLSYDYDKAATVKSGYLPVLDEIMQSEIGICFDYAAVMTGMLRSQGVPCKLVVGYAGSAYHAWISVWVEGSGWVDGVIWFDGHAWQRMDPTFASGGNSSADILAYIGNGANYSAKYFY